MTRLAAGDLVFPTLQTPELGVRGRKKILELVLMTVFAGLTADVLVLARRDFVVIGSAGGGEIARDRPETYSEQRQQRGDSEFSASELLLHHNTGGWGA